MSLPLQWKHKGQIFKCFNDLPEEFTSHAQSPQAIILNDRIRIYFSTRKRDGQNKFLSYIAYVDYDFNWNKKSVSQHQIIPLGKKGCFDEHGIFPFSPLQDGNRLIAYTCGWSRRVSVDVETSTGLVESHDNGHSFNKIGDGPVFSATLHEPMLVGDSFVRKYNGLYHMWYIYGTKWRREFDNSQPERVYKIGHATSVEGINWKPENKAIIKDILHKYECQALPSILYHNGLYHMVFCYRDVFGFRDDDTKSYKIGYAWSIDLIHWARDDAFLNLKPQDKWDASMMAYPHLLNVKDKIYCLYNGNYFGREGFGLQQVDESTIQFKCNQGDASQIKNHFYKCGDIFLEKLFRKVDIESYTNKILNNATRFELWDHNVLCGMLAFYINPEEKKIYVTHMGINITYQKQGLGKALLKKLEQFCHSSTEVEEIILRVDKNNSVAISFYNENGFQLILESNSDSFVGVKK